MPPIPVSERLVDFRTAQDCVIWYALLFFCLMRKQQAVSALLTVLVRWYDDLVNKADLES